MLLPSPPFSPLRNAVRHTVILTGSAKSDLHPGSKPLVIQGGVGIFMVEGKIIEYIDKREIALSVCLKDRGSKLQLLTASNHEVSISPKRALLISSAILNTSRSKGELLKELKVIEKIRIDYMTRVSVQDLWELTHEENKAFTYKYLAQLSFGRDITDDHISALVRALFADGAYFKIKDGSFIPNSPYKVEQIIKTREAAELRERE